MRVALGQIDTTVGDLDGNRARIVRFAADAAAKGAEVVVFPELAICGYPPEDLVLRPGFLDALGVIRVGHAALAGRAMNEIGTAQLGAQFHG